MTGIAPTTITAGYVRRGEVLSFGGSTLEVADFELGPEQGEVSFFGPSVFATPRSGERYIFNLTDEVTVVSYRWPEWEA